MTYSAALLENIKLSTFEASNVSDLDFERLDGILKQTSFAIIRGLIEPKVIRDGVDRILASHDPDNDHAATGEAPTDIMDNFQKVSIGGAEHSGVYRPRCMRTFYNPIWAEDVYGLRQAFIQTAKVRNRLYMFHEDFAISSEEEGFWTAARVHNYPRGGGFLVSHKDNIVPSVQSKAKLSNEYFQPVIVMSKKGGPEADFEDGGGFFEVEGERFFYEQNCELGDIIIYSGLTVHGVEDIDLKSPFDSRSAVGRFAGFVTLYKVFTKKNEVVEFLE